MIIPCKIQKKYVPQDGVAVPFIRISLLGDLTIRPGDELMINPKDSDNLEFIEEKEVSPQDIPYWAR